MNKLSWYLLSRRELVETFHFQRVLEQKLLLYLFDQLTHSPYNLPICTFLCQDHFNNFIEGEDILTKMFLVFIQLYNEL